MKKRILSLILIMAMALSMLAGCKNEEEQVESMAAPLIVGYTSFNGVFSPFFARSSADKDVVTMTQAKLLSFDRMGSVIYDAIEGETIAYEGMDYTYYGIADIDVKFQKDGTAVYDFNLREDVKFSDGEILDADDLIFTMYVLCDPMYDGSYSLKDAPIAGLQEYRTSMSTLFDAIIYAGKENTDYTFWDAKTQEQFWAELEVAGTQFAQDIVDYLAESSGTTSVSQAAKLWGYEGLSEEATATDFFYMMCEQYAWDLRTLNKAECVGKSLFTLMETYGTYSKGIQLDPTITGIAGIEKTGDHSVRVIMTEQNAANIQYFDIPVAPMHYYGDASLYDYEAGTFGFVKGDLSLIHEKDALPMGAGAYVYEPADIVENEKTTADLIFHPNVAYYLGCAKTQDVHFVEIAAAKKINGIVNGKIDLTDVSMTKKVANNIVDANQKVIDNAVAEAEAAGTEADLSAITDVVSSHAFDYAGYGYIGLNANVLRVNEDSDSKESVALRKAFATLFSVYRDEVVSTYFGNNASVVNYPVSDTSWAAPKEDQKGYQTAYSKDVDGNVIYTDEMTQEEKYAAAKEAALAYFEAAGYTVEDGIIKSAPEGASMTYEIMIPANGCGEHPSYMIVVDVKEVLAELGIHLVIRDVTDDELMWDALREGTCAIWVAAWDSAADPDVYELYHSQGKYSYMYGLDNEKLSGYLEDARKETNEAARTKLYQKCYDIILEQAVEVPVYQKQDGVIYSNTRIKEETLTPDMTIYYGWLNEIHKIEMYDIIIEETE